MVPSSWSSEGWPITASWTLGSKGWPSEATGTSPRCRALRRDGRGWRGRPRGYRPRPRARGPGYRGRVGADDQPLGGCLEDAGLALQALARVLELGLQAAEGVEVLVTLAAGRLELRAQRALLLGGLLYRWAFGVLRRPGLLRRALRRPWASSIPSGASGSSRASGSRLFSSLLNALDFLPLMLGAAGVAPAALGCATCAGRPLPRRRRSRRPRRRRRRWRRRSSPAAAPGPGCREPPRACGRRPRAPPAWL